MKFLHAIVFACLIATSPVAVGAAPNILLILVDDMGYGDPGCYNPRSKIPTPNIDRLAREGMRFTDAHAAGPVCHPSRYGLLTGSFPFRADVSVWPRHPVIQKDRLTVAGLLRSAGYRTAMVGKWHLGFEENGYDQPLPGGPVDRGFDSFFGIRASTDIPPYFYLRDDRAVAPPTDHVAASHSEGWSPIQGAFWREGGIAPGLELKDVLPRFTDEAVGVVRRHEAEKSGKPLFLYLAYPAPHTPWLPAPEYLGRGGAGMYGNFMVMVDAMIGRVLNALEETGVSGETLVIFSSDNGPVWYDRDVERFGHDSSGGLRGMKGDAWEGGHRMPFIVRWPGRVEAGSVGARLISFTDVMATLAEVAEVPLPPAAAPDSFSFLPVLEGRADESEPRGPLVLVSSGGMNSLRSGPWKLIDGLGSGGFTAPAREQPAPGGPAGQLYHLERDPAEGNNLYQEEPAVVRRLQAELAEVLAGSRTR